MRRPEPPTIQRNLFYQPSLESSNRRPGNRTRISHRPGKRNPCLPFQHGPFRYREKNHYTRRACKPHPRNKTRSHENTRQNMNTPPKPQTPHLNTPPKFFLCITHLYIHYSRSRPNLSTQTQSTPPQVLTIYYHIS